MSLRSKLAEHGFESNDDYDHALRCLLEQAVAHLRVLHVDGAAGRRKTAFAQALGPALGFVHTLYHDFSAPEPPAPAVVAVLEDGSPGPTEGALTTFERVMSEGCAYSESAATLLILDQLQAAHFNDQRRLYDFTMTREWTNASGTVQANGRNFLLAVISEQALYHSLAKCSFRVWTDAQRAFLDYRPADYALGPEAVALFEAMSALCLTVNCAPTPSEFGMVLQDLLQRARSEEQIRQSLFGRVESAQREYLYSPESVAPLRAVMLELERLLGADEVTLG
ncbi:MAG: hypothetical protein ACREO3_04805 [Arenimonas sp.]